jgi:hypothetical protein
VDAVDGLTSFANAWSWLAGLARDLIDGIENWVAGFSAIDFIFTVIAVWAVYWIWSALRAITRLGPVEVSVLDHDKPEEPEIHALTALLRERLAKSGLVPPPSVPAGSPQTNLIAAVESSGHPQAPWIAKALQLVPQPPRSPEYKLSGTLLKQNGSFGLRYWLQPAHEGRSLLETVQGAWSPEHAVRRAATEIFLAISHEAAHVFPHWAQWESRSALVAYIDGIDARLAGNDARAEIDFHDASDIQVANLLPRLQLANLLERKAASKGETPEELFEGAKRQADVLRRYLGIGVARSDVVAARYRAGIVAGMLATTCASLATQEQREAIRDAVGLTEADGSPAVDVPAALHNLAARESKAAYQLVGRFQVLFDKHRLRHRFEPTGIERRRLRRTIAISRLTLKIRRMQPTDPEWKVWLHRTKVRWLHLGLFRASAGWNAHYNAGCFYALLYDRELNILLDEAAQAQPGAGAGAVADG